MIKRFSAFIRTRSPLHIAAPGSMRFDPATGKTVYGGQSVGVPCTGIQREVLFNEAGEAKHFPVIAANNISGRLRRHAARIILEAIRLRGQKVSLAVYNVLQCGAVTGNPDGKDMTLGEYRQYRDDPYFGLFGGGPKMMRRCLEVENALPVHADTTANLGSMAHPHANRHAQGDHFTDVWGFRRNDDLRDLVNIHQAAEVVESFEAEFNARQQAILGEVDREKGSSKTSVKTYSALEFVRPGTLFDFSILMKWAISDAQAGLFLLTLDSLAETERLGGYGRNGFGRFSFDDAILLTSDGKEHQDAFHDGRLNRDDPMVAHVLSAWHAASQKIDATALASLIAPDRDTAPDRGAA
ncbi:MAG: type IV CRISPR-associated protein Csf2 [Planctomycetia bacterium]|nr:type IV CRISPR-associated protein Csf2 [Planctomycetia bacterium]